MTTLSSRFFGIEFECIGSATVSKDEAKAALAAIGLDLLDEGYNHNVRPSWKIVTDGSLSSYGWEIVSPKLSGEAGLAEAVRVANALVNAGFTVDSSCGTHVHVDATDLNAASIINVVKRYMKFEAKIDGFMPLARRNSRWCRTTNGMIGADLENSVKANPSSRTLVRSAFSRNDRYHKVNLASLAVHNTVEFRQHQGTLSQSAIDNWVRFCVNFVEQSVCEVETVTVAPVPVASVSTSTSNATVVAPSTSTVVNDGHRANAVDRKFAILAACLYSASEQNYTARSESLMAALGCSETVLASYVSRMRTKYGIRVKAKRGTGYYMYRSEALALMERITADGFTADVAAVATFNTAMTARFRRSFGGVSVESVGGYVAPVAVAPTPRATNTYVIRPVVAETSDSWDAGLAPTVRNYFAERAAMLSTNNY